MTNPIPSNPRRLNSPRFSFESHSSSRFSLFIIRISLFIFCFSLFTLQVKAQNIDSLYGVWKDEKQPDSTRIIAYSNYIWSGYLFSNPDTATVLIKALLTYGEQHKYPKANAMGYNLMAITYTLQSNYPKALDYFQRSLNISEEIGDKQGMAGPINNIGLIYNTQGDYLKALGYFQRSLKNYEEIGDKMGMAKTINNIGLIYQKQGELPKALESYQRGVEISQKIDAKNSISTGLYNIGTIFQKEGDYTEALDYYHRALKIMEEIGDKQGVALAMNGMGTICNRQGNFLKALEYCKKGLSICQEVDFLEDEKEACECLYDAYKALGKGNEALIYLERIQVIDDSLNAEETAKKLQQMEFDKQVFADSIAQVETDRLVMEEHQEEVRQKNQTRNILIGTSLLVILLAGGIYSRLRYTRKAKAIIENEKDRSENLLLNILPADIAAELKEKGRADARDFEMVSILFTDFKGFTEASEKLSAQELVSEINTCFEAFDGIMGKYNIEKIKTIGDAYMAAGGLPVPSDNSVKNTVMAALEMQAFISKRKIGLDATGLPGFEMRVGIHTGPVVAGIVGVKKFAYDIWGDTVNTASRIESSGEVGEVNISASTYELLKDVTEFTFESRGKIEAKGKGEIEMYFVSLIS